jgi:hypothetical protein
MGKFLWLLAIMLPLHLAAFEMYDSGYQGEELGYEGHELGYDGHELGYDGQEIGYDEQEYNYAPSWYGSADRFSFNFCCDNSFWNDFITDWQIEGRVSYFYPFSHLFRKIYNDGGVDYGLEVSKKIYCDIYGWAGLDWFYKRGHSDGLHNKTSIRLNTGTFGLKYMYTLPFFDSLRGSIPLLQCVRSYIGLGAAYSKLRIWNHSHFVRERVNKYVWGGILKTGFQIDLGCGVFLDIFSDYTYQPVDFKGKNCHREDSRCLHTSQHGPGSHGQSHRHSDINHEEDCGNNHGHKNVDLGGIRTGIGLGYSF